VHPSSAVGWVDGMAGIWEYITETRDMVHNLESRLQNAKDNVEQIQKIMAMWSKTPLFERFENKNSSLLNLSDRDDRTKRRYEEIASHGAKIHELLQVHFILLPFLFLYFTSLILCIVLPSPPSIKMHA